MPDRTVHHRLAARPPVRTPIERANDHALEGLILVARLTSAAAALFALVSVMALAWTLDWRWAALAAVQAVWAVGVGWWGWWVKGNEEWRRG